MYVDYSRAGVLTDIGLWGIRERMSRCSDDSRPADDSCTVTVVDETAVDRARAALPGARGVQTAADIFSALSDPTRLRILLALAASELCVCDLAAITGVSASAVSHQLRLLRDRDLVAFRRDGKRAVYRLADAHVEALLEQGIEHAEEHS